MNDMENEWTTHPSGIKSRPLPDRMPPAMPPNLGFKPMFKVEIIELGTRLIVSTCTTLAEACRYASRECKRRRYIRGWQVEITDKENQKPV